MTLSRKIREAVRSRADERCEYCCKPDGFEARKPHVDHILPQKHGGTDELHNLAWACFQCNSYKGPVVSSYDTETGELTPLFNPRTQKWDEHFILEDAIIIGKSAIGRVSVRIFNMNNPYQLEVRKNLIEAGLW